jgi:dihydroflavonol-4-reductase
MKVLVTGGSGFIGSHAVAEMLERGHQLRLLARSPERVASSLASVGVSTGDVEVVEGDILDEPSVERAVTGMDALLHAAAVYSMDLRRREEVAEAGVRGARVVLETAARTGLDPIVHVSSYVALLPSDDALDPDSPTGEPAGSYASAKAAADRLARGLQEDGAPVAIVYPGFVVGPHDPGPGVSNEVILTASGSSFAVGSSLPVTDVRDVATVLARLLDGGRGPRRYLVTGQDISYADLVRRVRALGGRSQRASVLPEAMALGLGRVADVVQRMFPGRRIPLSHESMWLLTQSPRCDMSKTVEELEVTPRDLDDTLRDTLAWMAAAGHLPATAAPR